MYNVVFFYDLNQYIGFVHPNTPLRFTLALFLHYSRLRWHKKKKKAL